MKLKEFKAKLQKQEKIWLATSSSLQSVRHMEVDTPSVKVGRKWVTLDGLKYELSTHADSLRLGAQGWGNSYIIFWSEHELKSHLERKSLEERLRKACSYRWISRLSTPTIKAILVELEAGLETS